MGIDHLPRKITTYEGVVGTTGWLCRALILISMILSDSRKLKRLPGVSPNTENGKGAATH